MSKQFIPCQCDLLAITCNFFFHVNLRAQFYTSRRTGDELGLDYGGVWEQTARKTIWRRTISSFPTRKSFSQISFSQCTACLDVRDGDQAELLSRRLEQYEETLRVMYQRITESRPDEGALSQMLHRATFERLKTNLGETGKPIL